MAKRKPKAAAAPADPSAEALRADILKAADARGIFVTRCRVAFAGGGVDAEVRVDSKFYAVSRDPYDPVADRAAFIGEVVAALPA